MDITATITTTSTTSTTSSFLPPPPTEEPPTKKAREEVEEEEGEEEVEAGEAQPATAAAASSTTASSSKKRDKKKEQRERKKKAQAEEKKRREESGEPDVIVKKTKMDLAMAAEAQPFVDGIYRRVTPYDFLFKTFAKGRWLGKGLLELFKSEFQAESPEYYEAAVRDGRVTLNGKQVPPETVVKNNDVIEHRVHRHEPPVTSKPIKIIHEDERYLVVDKPASIPVHPCGRYRHLTIVSLLGHEHRMWDMYPCHRLDRLTSGILIFAKDKASAGRMEDQIKNRVVHKEYICRVLGKFPEGETMCSEPILVVNHRVGVCCVSPQGKPCTTEFVFVRYDADSDTSIVRCKPETGRTHQLRVHLQYLGHCIANDPVYNAKLWGMRKGATVTLLNTDLPAQENVRDGDLNAEDLQLVNKVVDGVVDDIAEVAGEPFAPGEAERQPWFKPSCSECKLKRPDPLPHEMCIYLHAFRYVGEGWEYQTEMPFWAAEDYQVHPIV